MAEEQFPKFWKCPKCGSDSRLTIKGWEETHNGQCPPGTHWEHQEYTMQTPGDLFPKKVSLHWDICWECGTRYAFKAEITQGKSDLIVQMPKDSGKLKRN